MAASIPVTDAPREPATEESGLSLVLPATWHSGIGVHGGRCAASLIEAARILTDDEEQIPRSMSVLFLEPVEPGPAITWARALRRGRTAAVQVELIQHGQTRVIGLVRLGRPGPSPTFIDAAAPSAPPPERCAPHPPDDVSPPFTSLVDYRPVDGGAPLSGTDSPGYLLWMRLRDGQRLTPEALTVLADATAPAFFSRLRAPVPVPTLDLTVAFTETARHDDPWVLADIRNRVTHDGYSLESALLFDRHGRLLAQGQQLRRVLAARSGGA